MSTQSRSHLTPEQYLEIERKAEYKSEYIAGQMFAMSGASRAYNLLASNLLGLLHRQLLTSDCELYPSDMRVRVTRTGLYTYPDAVVVCDKPRFLDSSVDTLLNPTFVVEILSPSTEAYDLGRKFEHYSTIESLSEYLIVAHDRLHARLHTRQEGRWLVKGASSLEETLELRSIGCRISMTDLYNKVELPPSQISGELKPPVHS